MNTNTHITRDLDLEFGLSAIKESIKKVADLGKYTILSSNDAFNTYRIGKVDGLEMVNMNITLKKISDTSTGLKIDVVERLRNSGHEMAVNRIIDNFLDRLSKALTGSPDEEIKQAANKGCFGIIVFAISLPVGYEIIKHLI